MKTLYVTRHAKSGKKEDPSYADIERPLKKRGKRDAPNMAQRLQKMKAIPDRVISSPAIRAQMTAKAMLQEWGWSETDPEIAELLYPGDADEILLWVPTLPQEADRVMIVGHQPDLSRLVELLTGDMPGEMPTCAVACCEFGTDDWNAVVRGSGHLKWVSTPKNG
jgi:phosphohistidine phosphatase